MAALKAAYGLDVAEAWQSYRNLKDALDHAPGLVDLQRHPRITAREVREARLLFVREEAAALRTEVTRRERREARAEALAEAELYEDIEYVEYEFSADTAGET